ncbi:hypothetical protein GJ496_009113 [Pomphorhynchus laevis]|nr:hypothetical protein GJ496_009113 [Pomphorhynchus laevis]
MSFLFGRKQTPDDMLRENQRTLNKAMREIDREHRKMEMQEQKIIVDIKQMARKQQMDVVRILAKDLIRTRRQMKKFLLMRTNIKAVQSRIISLKSQNSMASAMRGVSQAMMRMNKQFNTPQVIKIMQDFERQSQMFEMKDELMSDAIDEAMIGSDEDDEMEESDQLVQQVLDELGIELSGQINSMAPAVGESESLSSRSKAARVTDTDNAFASTSSADDNLEARLNALRRN